MIGTDAIHLPGAPATSFHHHLSVVVIAARRGDREIFQCLGLLVRADSYCGTAGRSRNLSMSWFTGWG